MTHPADGHGRREDSVDHFSWVRTPDRATDSWRSTTSTRSSPGSRQTVSPSRRCRSCVGCG